MLSREGIVYNWWGEKKKHSTNKQPAALLGATKWFRNWLIQEPQVVPILMTICDYYGSATALAQKAGNGRKERSLIEGTKACVATRSQPRWNFCGNLKPYSGLPYYGERGITICF